MFLWLARKEVLGHLLDYRFFGILAACIALTAVGTYVGIQRYRLRFDEYTQAVEARRSQLEEILDRNSLIGLTSRGQFWNRRPEPLSSIVSGLSGVTGREAKIQHYPHMLLETPPHIQSSPFEFRSASRHFGVLDLAQVIEIVVSLAVLVLVYDTICGEKESGTLRLLVSFPVPRATLALGKMFGAVVATSVPLALSFVTMAAVLSLATDLPLGRDEWGRIVALFGVFNLYVIVLSSLGLWISALVHRGMISFLISVLVWSVLLFVVPNTALRIGRTAKPAASFYDLDRKFFDARQGLMRQAYREVNDHWSRTLGNWTEMSEVGRGEHRRTERFDREILGIYLQKMDAVSSVMGAWATQRRNDLREQRELVGTLASISPLGAERVVVQDLARTGIVQQEKIERALSDYYGYLRAYTRSKMDEREWSLRDFAPFSYRDRDTVSDCLVRNVSGILNLVLLALLGFAGTFVRMLRYDVR